MEFKQIEAFVNVVKYQSFSKAADATFLTQPTISSHIISLEKELGLILLDRTGKAILPTEHGASFLHYALDLINTREKAIQKLQVSKDDMSGILNIKTSSIPGMYILPPLITGFHDQYEQIKYFIEQSDSKNVIDDLNAHRGELGFTGYHKDKNLEFNKVYTDKSVLIAPDNEKYRALYGKTNMIGLHDLKNEPFVWREEGSATRLLFEKLYHETCGKAIHVIATINNAEAIINLVSEGLGISVIPQLAADAISESKRILIFDFEEDVFQREFYLVNRKNAVLSPVAEAFKRYVLAHPLK